MISRPARRPALIFLVCLAALVACGANARTTALRTGLVSLNVARDTLRAASKEREKQIVDACNPLTCNKKEGHAQLDAWRGTVDKIYVAIEDGYVAILAAFVLDDAKSDLDAATAVTTVLSLVKEATTKDAVKPASALANAADKTTDKTKEKTP